MTASAASTDTACTLDSRPSVATCEALKLMESHPQGWHASLFLSTSFFLPQAAEGSDIQYGAGALCDCLLQPIVRQLANLAHQPSRI